MEHDRPPQHGADRDIFERLYALRLDRIRAQAECRELLADLDHQKLLAEDVETVSEAPDKLDDAALLEALGVSAGGSEITELRHVRSQSEKRVAEEIGDRERCEDFERFEPLFEQVRRDIKEGGARPGATPGWPGSSRASSSSSTDRSPILPRSAKRSRRSTIAETAVCVIYDNGTESDIPLRSLQRALHRDETGRRITDPAVGPLFQEEAEVDGSETGTIYVLRSLSDHPEIASKRDVIHKVGVTGGDVEKRIANAKRDPTFLLAPVEVVATYKLVDINRTALEKLLHRFFADVRLDIAIPDRFGDRVQPREWFLVPLYVVEDVVRHLQKGDLHRYNYDAGTASLHQID